MELIIIIPLLIISFIFSIVFACFEILIQLVFEFINFIFSQPIQKLILILIIIMGVLYVNHN
jgi:hypothetical protein